MFNASLASIFFWSFRMGLLIHPTPFLGNGLLGSGLNPAELCALSVVGKLYLASKNGKRYNLQPP
jgi:hypothetical protein